MGGREMKKYKIVGTTNPWIAQHDTMFKGKTEITLARELTLREAQAKLLDFYREEIDAYVPNWGIAVMQHGKYGAEAFPTHEDGTRAYECDSRKYSIEEDGVFHDALFDSSSCVGHFMEFIDSITK